MIQSRLFPSQIFKMSYESEQDGVRFKYVFSNSTERTMILFLFFTWSLLEMNLLDGKQEESIKSFDNKSNIIVFIVDCSLFWYNYQPKRMSKSTSSMY